MIHDFNYTILLTYTWMMLGFLLMVLDLKFTQSIYLLFAGIGAIVASSSLAIHPELTWIQQSLVFIISTLAVSILFFNPLRLILQRKRPYRNIIGQQAFIIDPPQPWRLFGTARWSGTVIRIKFTNPDESHTLRANDPVEIVEVDGTLFTVSIPQEQHAPT